MDPKPFIKNEKWIHSVLLKNNKKSSRRAPAKAAGLQPKPPAIDSLLNLYAFSLKSKDLDCPGRRGQGDPPPFHKKIRVGTRPKTHLFIKGRSSRGPRGQLLIF